MNKQRTPGYYWVEILGLDLQPFWTIGKYTPAKLGGAIPESWYVPENITGRLIDNINENRILSPDEKHQLPFIDEDAPRDNFEQAAQNRQAHSCDVAPNYAGGWPRFATPISETQIGLTNSPAQPLQTQAESMKSSLGFSAQEYAKHIERAEKAANTLIEADLKERCAKAHAERVKEETQAHEERQKIPYFTGHLLAQPRLTRIINAILGRKL